MCPRPWGSLRWACSAPTSQPHVIFPTTFSFPPWQAEHLPSAQTILCIFLLQSLPYCTQLSEQ